MENRLRMVLSRTRNGMVCCLSSLCLLASVAPVLALQSGDFTYNKSATDVSITGYTGSGGVVAITNEIDFLPVTSVGNSAFYWCQSIKSVTIPDSVTSIGYSAFYGCTNLTNIVIPDSVTNIENSTFYGCTGLTNIVIPDNVTSIGDSAFETCLGLASVMIGSGVTNIGNRAFESCTGLTNVTIGSSVASIGYGAFESCISLSRVTIPASVTSIDNYYVFDSCTNLTDITVDPSNAFYSSLDGVLFNNDQTLLIQFPGGKAGSYVIPNSVNCIGDNAFSRCAGLTSVTIPDGVTSIGFAFSLCSGLTNIVIPASVTSIGSSFYGYNVFDKCNNLSTITVDPLNNAYSSADGVLFNMSQTRLIQCPGGKKGSYTIPTSVISIGSDALANCIGLTSVTIPDSVTTIGFAAFEFSTGLTNVTIGSSVTSIKNLAFAGCTGLRGIEIPTSVTSIAGSAFSGCTGLRGVAIPDSMTSIDYDVFSGCTGLTSVVIPDSVTSIGSRAFSGCTGLASVTIPDNVRSVGIDAFSSCIKLTRIVIPDSVESIGRSAFSGCTGLTKIVIPDSVTSIGSSAFSGCTGLTNIVIPGSVSSIADHVFAGCAALTGITLPASVISIGSGAFFGTTNLTRVCFLGNAPSISLWGQLTGADNATIYYYEGTTGWGATFGGRPTVMLPAPLKTNSANFVWARRIASTGNPDDELAMGLAMDSATNLYVTGWFDGINDFGGATLTNKSGGGQDLFVGKYNSAGVLQWARRAGGGTSERDEARGVGVDGSGNVYVAGGFCGTADFGSSNLTAVQEKAFFLAKYDSAGTVQWVRQNDGGDEDAYGTGLAVDASGNSYAVGCYGWDGSTVTFGSTTLPNPGSYSTFLVKYNSSGMLQWAKAVTGTGYAYSTKVVLDSAGNVCLGGTFEGSLTIGTTTLASAGGKDSFVAKFSGAGTLQWARQMGGSEDDLGDGGIAVDAANNVFVGGGYSSSMMRFGGTSLTNAGSWDAYVAKYNSAGALQWARRFGSGGLDLFSGVAADLQGNVYATGCISTNTTMGDPLSLNGWDAVAVKYDAGGSVQWVQTAGGSENDIGYNVIADPAGNTYFNGWFQDTAAFGTNTLQSLGFWNFFLAKLPADIPRDPFAGTYSPLIEFDNTIKNGVAIQQTTKALAVSQTDATHYSVQLSSPTHPTQGAFSFEAERVGNRIQNVERPIARAGWSLLDFFMMSDGTNGAYATISQEGADPQDVSFQVGSWSNFKGNVTIDDFVGMWVGESYGNENLNYGLNPGDFVTQSGGTTIVSKVDSNHIHLSSPGGGDELPLSIDLRVSGNGAFLESSPVVTSTSRFHAFHMRTDGQKVVFYVVGSELNDPTDISVTIGLGTKVRGDQMITFPALPLKGLGDADFAPGATASSGLVVSYASSDSNVARIVSGKIRIVGMGKTDITATQAGNNNWNPAPDATQELTVGKQIPVITWANPAAVTYGALLSAVQLNAKANVPGQFVYVPAAGVKLSSGTNALSVTFTPSDTNRYSSAAKSVALIVNKASQTITFKALPTVELGVTNFSAGATVSSGLAVEYASANPAVAEIVDGLIHVTGAGTAVITASQLGDFDIKAATPVTQTLTVKARLTPAISGKGTVTASPSSVWLYMPGTKITLTATPATGSTFLRWGDGSQATAKSLVMPNANVSVSAWFGLTTNIPPPEIVNPGLQRAMVGVPFALPLTITSDSLPTVTVTGLPAGLKYDAATKSITGVPTVSVTDKPVAIAAKNVNKTSAVQQPFSMTVDPLPAWALGTFNGSAAMDGMGSGTASMSVTPQGAASGKLTLRGTNLTFSSKSYAAHNDDGTFTLATTATVGKVAWPLTISVYMPEITDATGTVPPTLSKAGGALPADGWMALFRDIWKDRGMVTVLTNRFTGYYTAVLPGGTEYGSGYLTFTVDKLGGVKTTGKLADGTAVSLSGTLVLDEAGRAFTILYAAPAAYKGGGIFGAAEFFKSRDGAKVVMRLLDGQPFVWESFDPQATQVYQAGFGRYLWLAGGWYDTVGNLYAYYANKTLSIGTEGAPVPELIAGTNRYDSACWNPDGITVTVVTDKGGVMTGLSAPKAGVPVKAGTDTYAYGATNAVGLTIGLTRATGVFKGAFNAWFDAPKTHTAKPVAYEGVLTPEREDKTDGIEGRGFFLWADKSQYLNLQGKSVPYNFSWSYDLKLQSIALTPVTIDVGTYANPSVSGRWNYKKTEGGVIDTWTVENKGIVTENGQSVYLLQEYDEDGYPNDQQYWSTDFSEGLLQTGGLNDYGETTQTKWYWQPFLPMLMKTFIPGVEYTSAYTRADYAGVSVVCRMKTELDTVSVPYGKVACYKVTQTFSVSGEYHMLRRWYAENLGVVKSEEFNRADLSDGNVWELISYEP